MNKQILNGDVLEKLKEIPDESIDVICTSPPYWGLRDYGVEGQLGLEPDFMDYLKKMSDIMEECKRVLKATGTAWVNLGDSYNTSIKGNNNGTSGSVKQKKGVNEQKIDKKRQTRLKPKTLVGIPQRFMINCIDSGWICRNDIIWHKPNGMPDSTKDRMTVKHESVFLLSKMPKYYFDLNAIREKTTSKDKRKRREDGKKQAKITGGNHDPERTGRKSNSYGIIKNNNFKPQKYADGQAKGIGTHSGCYDADGNSVNHPSGKNPGNVWHIPTMPYPDAHFATFPVTLPYRILSAACPKQVCKKCGVPRTRITQTFQTDCGCGAGFEPGIVLDPFFGAGTTGLAAQMLGLRWMGIELNPEYVEVARKRLADCNEVLAQ